MGGGENPRKDHQERKPPFQESFLPGRATQGAILRIGTEWESEKN
jgi:hypothetical protein